MLLICQKMHLESLIITSIRDVTTAFTLFIKIGIWEISQIPKYLGNFPDTQLFGKFPRYPGIWEISQIPSYLGNFPDTQVFGKFQVFEGCLFSRFWKFLKCLGIWEISQIPRHFSDTQAFEKFPKFL